MADPKSGPSPPTWKLMVVKWAALFPVLLVLSYTIKWLPIDPPMWLKLMMETMITIPLLHYVITPWLDDVFENWLYAASIPSAATPPEKSASARPVHGARARRTRNGGDVQLARCSGAGTTSRTAFAGPEGAAGRNGLQTRGHPAHSPFRLPVPT